MDDERAFQIFMDVHSGLPRQGPGADECTLRALSLCTDLPDQPAVLDVGCGPGMQTLVLARALRCPVIAVDFYPPFLDQLKQRAIAVGLGDRIVPHQADMAALPFGPASFDLIWSEGAAYIMGFDKALAAWRSLLKPGGWIAVSEMVWLRPNPPTEVFTYLADEYPALTDVAGVVAQVDAAGYELRGHFTLPDNTWWDQYYTPLEAKLPQLRLAHAGDEIADRVIAETAREIDIRRRFADWYGYEFLIGRNPD